MTKTEKRVWLLTEKEVATMTARSLSAIRQDRHYGRGVPYHKIGRSVRYSLTDITAYLLRHRISTEER